MINKRWKKLKLKLNWMAMKLFLAPNSFIFIYSNKSLNPFYKLFFELFYLNIISYIFQLFLPSWNKVLKYIFLIF